MVTIAVNTHFILHCILSHITSMLSQNSTQDETTLHLVTLAMSTYLDPRLAPLNSIAQHQHTIPTSRTSQIVIPTIRLSPLPKPTLHLTSPPAHVYVIYGQRACFRSTAPYICHAMQQMYSTVPQLHRAAKQT